MSISVPACPSLEVGGAYQPITVTQTGGVGTTSYAVTNSAGVVYTATTASAPGLVGSVSVLLSPVAAARQSGSVLLGGVSIIATDANQVSATTSCGVTATGARAARSRAAARA